MNSSLSIASSSRLRHSGVCDLLRAAASSNARHPGQLSVAPYLSMTRRVIRKSRRLTTGSGWISGGASPTPAPGGASDSSDWPGAGSSRSSASARARASLVLRSGLRGVTRSQSTATASHRSSGGTRRTVRTLMTNCWDWSAASTAMRCSPVR